MLLSPDRYDVFPPGDFNAAMAKARHTNSRDLSRDPNSGRKSRLESSNRSTLDASTTSSRGRSPSRGGYYGAQMRKYSPSASSVASSNSKKIGVERSRVKQPWVDVTVDTGAPLAAPASDQQSRQRSRARPRSASPGGSRQLTRQRARPSPGQLQLRKRRPRTAAGDGSPASGNSPVEISKGTFWGLYSEEEARRRKTDEYYDEVARRTEEERRDIEERERSIAYVPPHRNVVSPGSLQRQKKGLRENLYRQLRGQHQ